MTTAATRVLQVLADTDRTDASLGALDLHAALASRGLAVRTVALGPGRRGGLDDVVPVLSPSPRSIAARTQLRRERAWADVVVLRGTGSVAAARSRWARGDDGGSVPAVAAVDVGDDPGPLPAEVAGVVITAAVAAPDPVAGGRGDGDGGRRGDGGVGSAGGSSHGGPWELRVPRAVDVSGPMTSPAARRVAREALGLPEWGPVARLVTDGVDRRVVASWRRALDGLGWPVVGTGVAAGTEPEVVEAAVDVVVWPGSEAGALVPRQLLVGAVTGQAVVVGACPATDGLLGGAAVVIPSGPSPGPTAEELPGGTGLDDEAGRASLASAAALAVRRHHSLDEVAGTWERVLRDLGVG